MPQARSQTWKNCIDYLKDYCSNCTLAGFSYIANQNLHFIERIFWLICVVFSAIGSYMLIRNYQRDFNVRAVSIVYESLPSTQKILFPTLAVCEMYDKNYEIMSLTKFIDETIEPFGDKYNALDIDTFIQFFLFPNFYREDNIKAWCLKPCQKGKICGKCPTTNFRQIHEMFVTKCENLFVSCEFSNKTFECCDYFLPLSTPQGNCFMFNSLLNNKRGSPTWFNNEIEPPNIALMKIATQKPMQVSVLNEEDIPHSALAGYKTEAKGNQRIFQMFMQTTINDPDVRDISPEFRQCRFPDELLDDTSYKAYSFTTCFIDCLRIHQMKECNCSLHYFMLQPSKKYPDCDFDGLLCLEKHAIVRPDARNLLPWSNNKYSCQCLPSCTENEFKTVYENAMPRNASTNHSTIIVTIPEFATERYRRQSLRTRLDVVVTIGGILGLFLGASILSGIEFIYYFTLRLFNNYRMSRTQSIRQ